MRVYEIITSDISKHGRRKSVSTLDSEGLINVLIICLKSNVAVEIRDCTESLPQSLPDLGSGPQVGQLDKQKGSQGHSW